MRHMERDVGGRSIVASTLMLLMCLMLGWLDGGMLVIGVALVSFWKSLSPSEFQAWFASHAHLVGRLMIPLGVGSIAVTVAAAVACWRGSAIGRRWLLIAAVSVMGVMVTYPLFFAATNEAFARGGLPPSMDCATELNVNHISPETRTTVPAQSRCGHCWRITRRNPHIKTMRMEVPTKLTKMRIRTFHCGGAPGYMK